MTVSRRHSILHRPAACHSLLQIFGRFVAIRDLPRNSPSADEVGGKTSNVDERRPIFLNGNELQENLKHSRIKPATTSQRGHSLVAGRRGGLMMRKLSESIWH